MPILTPVLWITTLLLAIPVLAGSVYYLLGMVLVRWWMNEKPPVTKAPPGGLPPVTFYRPLKPNVPDLAAKLTALAEAMLPGDQLLIGVEPGSPEEAAAVKVRDAHLPIEIIVVPCQPGAALNPKISKLVQMEALARHEHWILSDSETHLSSGVLRAFREEWRGCDVLTAPYRAVGAETWPQRLDAAATLLTLWPGLAFLRATHSVRLTLGACTGFRRADVQSVGGWAAFGRDLAEDNRLGLALARLGRRVRLSRQVVTLGSDALTWRDYWRHQQRVAVTYRVANRAGFAGAGLAQGVTAGLVLVACHPEDWRLWLAFGGVWAVRWFTARRMAADIGFPLKVSPALVLAASVVETVCWLLSWPAERVWWAGTHWRLDRDGRLSRPDSQTPGPRG